MALSGDWSLPALVFSGALGGLLPRLVRPLGGEGFRRVRLARLPGFLLYFLKELLVANLKVAAAVVATAGRLRPAIVAVPLTLDRDAEIALLANLITLTPGTLSLEVSPDRRTSTSPSSSPSSRSVGTVAFTRYAEQGASRLAAALGISPSGAVAFAQALGVSELVIGLTIVAAGTSLPEVATAYTAYLVLAAQQHDALPDFSAVMEAFVLPLTAVTLAIVGWRAWRRRTA